MQGERPGMLPRVHAPAPGAALVRRLPILPLMLTLTTACSTSSPSEEAPPTEQETTRRAPEAQGEASAQAGLEAEQRAALEELGARLVDDEHTPGLAVALVRGDQIEVMTWGIVDRETQAPVEPSTIFQIGSVTKVFTSTLLARQVVAGELELQTPVAELVPEGWEVPAGAGPITLEALATHTSGLPALPAGFAPATPQDPYAGYGPERLRAGLAATALAREPGAGYQYSNLGAGLLGYALGQHAGSSWAEAVRAQLLEPLALEDTYATLERVPRARLATGYDAADEPTPPWTFEAMAGAGAMCSDVEDMARLIQLHLGAAEAPAPLSEALEMTRQARRERPGGRIGLGWHIGLPGLEQARWHNGQTSGYHSFIGFDPEAGVGVVALANSPSMTVDSVAVGMLRVLTGQEHGVDLGQTVEVSEEVLEEHVGSYQLAPGARIEITRQDTALYAQVTGQQRLRIYPRSPTEFAYRAVEAALVFERDEQGRTVGLVLHQGGRQMPAPRVEADDASEQREAPAR